MKHLIILIIIIIPFYAWVNHQVAPDSRGISGNSRMNPYAMIEEGQSLLKEGDLLVRLNRDPSSRFIKCFNHRDKSYSHSGIVFFENGYPYVYHIVDGEENPDEKMRKDSLSRFCSPRKNIAYGIYRYDMSDTEINSMKNIIHAWYASGLKFDGKFNLATDDRMYCSEMISKAVKKASANRIIIQPTEMSAIEAGILTAYTHLPFQYTNHLLIIPIDALYVNPFCHLVKKYNY